MEVSEGEGPHEGIRYLTSGTFGHQPFGDTLEGRLEHPCIPESRSTYGIELHRDARWLEAIRL
jgi:hypothetical protein